MPTYVNLLIALLVSIVPFVAGGYLAKRFRMPDHGWKIGVVLFAVTAGLVVMITGWPPGLGIDLKGGVTLVYEIDPEKKKEAAKDVDMARLIEAIKRRVNPGGHREVTIREYGKNQVEIIIPKAEQAELDRIKKILTNLGSLEFRILATERTDKNLIDRARKTDADAIYDGSAARNRLAWWVPIEEGKASEFRGGGDIATREVVDKEKNQKTLQVLVLQDPFNVEGKYLDGARPGVDERGRPCVNFTFDSKGAKLFAGLTGNNLPEDVTGFSRRLGIILNGEMSSAPNIIKTISDRGEITGDFDDKDVKELVSVLNAGALPAALTTEPISELKTGPTLGRDTIRRGAVAIAISLALVLVFMLVYYRFAGAVACLALLMTLILILAIIITIQAELTLPGLAGLVLTVGMAVDANVLIYERMREELDRGAALRMAIRNGFARATTTIVDANLTTLITATVLYVIGTDQVRGFAVTLWLGVVLSMFTAIFCSRVVFDVGEKQRWITRLSMMRMLGGTQIDFLGLRRLAAVASALVIAVGLAAVVVRAGGLLDIDFTGGVSVYVLFNKEAETDTATVRQSLEHLPEGLVDADTLGALPETFFKVTDREAIRDLSDEEDRKLAAALKGLAREEKLPKGLLGLDDVSSLKDLLIDGDEAMASRLITFANLAGLARAGSLPDLTVSDVQGDVEMEGETTGPCFLINTSCANAAAVEQCLDFVFPGQLATNSMTVDSEVDVKPEEPKAKPSAGKKPATKAEKPDAKVEKPAAKAEAKPEADAEKPATKAEKPATKAEKPGVEEEKPAAGTEKPEVKEEKPAAGTEKPGVKEGKPATKGAEKPPAGDRGESRTDLPPASLLASVDPGAVLLAQAEASAEKPVNKTADTPSKPAAAKPPVAKPPVQEPPVEKPPHKPPAEKPAGKPGPGPALGPGETRPAEPAPKPGMAPGATPGKAPAPKPAGAPGVKPGAAAKPSPAGLSVAELRLTFARNINYETLTDLIGAQIDRSSGESLEVMDKERSPESALAYGTWRVRLKAESPQAVVDQIQENLKHDPFFPSSTSIGSKVAGSTRNQAVAALLASLACIVAYIWVRFQRVTYGLAAVVALVHDVMITLGVIALTFWLAPVFGFLGVDQFKIGLPVLAAFLTIIGYSLNDTIIVFDRIREVKGKSPRLTEQIVNTSINQTLSRTLITSGTTFLVVLVLYIGGGQGIHAFAFSLLVGVIVGTYSSIYVASPVLLWMTGASGPSGGK